MITMLASDSGSLRASVFPGRTALSGTFSSISLSIQCFLTAFNPDGKVNTIRFIPVPPEKTTPPTTSVQDKIKETDIQVCTGNFKLPGTLTLPKNGKDLPVVIWYMARGASDRDETVGANKPFRDLAYGLAERGIAVIRYDKRTKVYGADSAPAGKEITFDEESVDDALSAIKLARSIPTINPERIYILGHSLGGTLLPASPNVAIKFRQGLFCLPVQPVHSKICL